MVERLKRGTLWEPGADGRLRVRDSNTGLVKLGGSQAIAGTRAILLFGYKRDEPGAKEPWLEVCGALPLNEGHLAMVRRGIAQDERPDE